MTPFLIAFLVVVAYGAGAATTYAVLAGRIRRGDTHQRAIREAHERGIIEGQARRARNLPPTAPNGDADQ